MYGNTFCLVVFCWIIGRPTTGNALEAFGHDTSIAGHVFYFLLHNVKD
jgi:hypothetical protein